MVKLGVIGYGGRAADIVQAIEKTPLGATVTAIADINRPAVLATAKEHNKDLSAVRMYDAADAMLDGEDLDGVIVATRCSLHTEMALKVLARNKPLFLEKPVATTLADYRRLAAAAASAKAVTLVSFPLRVTPVAQTAGRIIRSGQLGRITHVQATNNVPYGEVYFQHWYRDERETGGLFLQKATHDIDVINYLLGEAEPVRVAGMTSKQVFRGDKPAGRRCIDCPEKLTCPESKQNPTMHSGTSVAKLEEYQCCFAADTGNEDCGDALIEYAGGARANYSQNFYSRRGAAVRRIRAIGHLGTVEFDWYSEKAVVWMHHNSRVETFDCSTKGGHGGGDTALAVNFLQAIAGQAESAAPLSAGLRSVLICLLARESARTGQMQDART